MSAVQIYHITNTDTEQIAWCLDSRSDTVCLRTPLVFSVLIEALSVTNPTLGLLTDKSHNIPLTATIFKKFLSERKTNPRSLAISAMEEVKMQDVYFFQGGYKKPYLRVFFSNMKGFHRFRDLFQGREGDDEEVILEIPNDNNEEHPLPQVENEDEDHSVGRLHKNVMLITEGTFARFRILESDIAPYWHWLIHHGIRAASTVSIPPDAVEVGKDDPGRLSKANREYKNIVKLDLHLGGDLSTHPTILSWDIESLSENIRKFPNACAIGDVAFFISAYIKKYGDSNENSRRVGIYLVDSLDTLGLTEPKLADGTQIIIVQSEEDLLMAFWNLVREVNPQILMGYNTMGFDSRYLHHKMSIYHRAYPNLSLMQDCLMPTTNMRQFTWSSSAYKAVECWYYDTPGMLVLDLFVEFKRSESLKAYTLDAVSEFFLNEHKVDLKAQEMFKIYLEYQSGTRNERTRAEMRRIAEYGMQDSILPARLFDLRTQWITYIQMASIMGVGIMDLITRGQTLRTKANIYRMCRELNFVINVPRDKPSFQGKFKGAYVCEMKAGLYNDVIVYDFASLYPSTIAAYNLCYSTFIHPRDWHFYPPHMYTSFQVSMGQGSTEKREVRYMTKDVFKGILPRVVEGFLKARQETKDALKIEKDPVMKGILDKKQLAIKVSNNSVYGAVGADFSSHLSARMSDICLSSLGLKWIAMTVTEIGQILIKGCTSFLQKNHGAVNIYGDTDSTFVIIPPLVANADGSPLPTLWKRAETIAKEFNATLPPPLKIELEKIIRMVGLTAKRYLYRKQDKAGVLETEMNFKGVVATRRDTCKWQVKLFTAVAESILQDLPKDDVIKIIYKEIITLMNGEVPIKNLLVGCSVAETYKSSTCRMAILKDRMARLGRPIAGGSRVEFLITQKEVLGEDGVVKYETPYYRGARGGFKEANVSSRVRMNDEYVQGVTKLDFAYYVAHLGQKSVDQLFAAAFHGDTVIGPLVDGLSFDPSTTIEEMKLVIGTA